MSRPLLPWGCCTQSHFIGLALPISEVTWVIGLGERGKPVGTGVRVLSHQSHLLMVREYATFGVSFVGSDEFYL